ncbi:rRNA biogenesis protein nop56/nop58 [Halogeometricum borinquense DSM 11551]|uniref:rRNA biogenesis protein Nop56/Nop58 n=1 Tax=Halogeometricum borinquense (strain ATCC 700274 / DSM 11551 / JCM 10706 / KCTC 4070 / PR3) TaxID=469382 RepID=E4NTR2_HALBP|nr:NOP5/NOP56 family protein [Halogeometricum borinquense]ADQ67114.1 rRNA biogenesis protein Nop56/Nop58 [Halogeometricum borinquense DSM 11551]ELY29662.1 rRNA biogenesis protein nop56/nop58 [Halogeometricum borinquense DSM 11551]
MNDGTAPTGTGWFEDIAPDDAESASEAIADGEADEPRDWPALAVESGHADSEDEYYDQLREATLTATRAAVRERERADDKQLVHAVRAMDDAERTANELAERLAEWAGTLYDDAGVGIEGARDLADKDPQTPVEDRVVSYARRVADLADERDDLRAFVESRAPALAPNLAEMAGPVLAARLIALAGGLERLAKMPSGTVQVLGAEDALFAHLEGRGSSPKHGVIYVHEYVRGTHPEHRGSAARAFAGKLAIAARIDHYSGEFKSEIHEELAERMETIRAREVAE